MTLKIRATLVAMAVLSITPTLAAEQQFVIHIKDHQFVPAELHVPAGTKVQIIIDNQDDAAEEFESYSLNREKHVPPKSTVELFIGPLTAGRYVYEGEDRETGGKALGVIEAR